MKKVKTIQFSKKNGKTTISQESNLKKAIEGLPDGNYVIRIEPNEVLGNPRKKYFAIVGFVAIELGYDTNDLHDQFKTRFNDGKSTNLFKSNLEWSDYINKVVVFCRTELEINVPDSRDFTYQKWLEMEDNRRKLIKI